MATKRVKLKIHPKTFCEEDLIVNIDALNRDKLQLSVGDVIELAPCTDNGQTPQSGPFLQIETVPQEVQSKGGPLSISREIAGAFSLEGVREVHVKRVEREEVGLDLVELRIKDQCLTRSDMWRVTSSMADKFVHTGKKLEHAGVRVTVSRLWSQHGAVVLSGAVLSRTRVVFRSASVQLVLYLQISAEMWHFDQSGDLYFDKAVRGFLRELFQHWQEEGCNHEVTLLFFWRAFYDKSMMEGLSEDVKSSVQRDKRGRNYEDFYKVIAGGESFADWSSKLVDIKRTFTHLKASLVRERGEGVELSSAAEGNMLEAINLAMNVFQKHYMDCSFSMTGHQIIIVTAGAGIFEVDHELTRLTNERIISGGVATDLVCLTDQPLHAVPLLKFQDGQDDSDYYHIPYWINYSFYSPSHSRNWFRFQPRLQLSDHLVNAHLSRGQRRYKGSKLYNPFTVSRSSEDSRSKALEDRLLNRVDYDEYDAAVFSLTPSQGVKPQTSNTGRPASAKTQRSRYHSTGESAPRQSPPPISRDLNDPFDDSEPLSQSPGSRSIGNMQIATKDTQINTSFDATSLRNRFMTEEPMDSSVRSGRGFLAGSAESLHHLKPSDIPTRRNKSLINPFNPKVQHTDLTAYHRRWSHVFPRDKAGVAFQVHHVIKEESQDMSHDLHRSSSRESAVSLKTQPHFENHSLASSSGLWMNKATDSIHLQEDHYSDTKLSPNLRGRGNGNSPQLSVRGKGNSPQLSVRGRGNSPQLSMRGRGNSPQLSINTTSSKLPSENFASARRQGADWRSLTEPACLPVTTDYFPGQEKLANEFYEYHTTMVASTYSYREGESSGEKNTPAWITDHQDVSTFQVFSEMVSQRISQGFQLVFEPHGRQKGSSQETIFSVHKALTRLHEEVANSKKRGRLRDITVRLSLGRVFQLMKLNYPDLVVWTYKPKSREVTLPISSTYQLSTAAGSEFTTQQAEFCHTHTADYNWNYLDQHICGYPDFEELGESQKYWRCRYLLLPSGTHSQEGVEHWASLVSNFVRFIEFLNHIKRGSKPGSRQSSLGGLKRQVSLPTNSIASIDVSTSRVSSPFEPHSTPHSPLPRSANRLSEIQEEKQPQSPHPDRHRSSDSALKFSEFLSNRPTSPYLASSQPKSESRKGGIITSSSTLSVKSDTNRKHRRTSSHDSDLQRFKESDPKLKARGSPQLLRKTQGSQVWKQEQSGSRTNSPSHSKSERKVRKQSNDGGIPVEVTPPTPSEESIHSIVSERSTGTSLESFYQIPLLNSSSPVQLIAQAMSGSEDGIDFLSNLPGLKSCCFVAMEAVSWVMDKISGVQNRGEAVRLLQCMVKEDLVIHASGDPLIPFIDGYFLYQLPLRDSQEPPPTDPHRNKDNVDKSFVFVESLDYEKFTKRWFEVRVHHPVASMEESTLLTVGASPSSMTSFPASFQRSGAAYYMHFEGKEHGDIPSSMLNRFVEMNPDPQNRSDRPEWCYVRYDHAYRPQCAFQLEFQWMVATMNLLNQLIQNWVSKATRCGFSLVPAPMVPSLTTTSHPFSQQHFIPLHLPPTFPYLSCDTTPLYKLFNSLLTKFSFLLDPATLPQSSDVLFSHYSSGEFTSRLFIHTSGVAFVQPFCDLDESSKATMSHDQRTAAVDIKGGLRDSLRKLSVPIGSSTPVGGSPSDGLYIPPMDRVKGHSRCGFYWYRNHLLLRQNATSQEEHAEVLSQLTEFCTDANGGLTEFCNLMDYYDV